MASRDEDRIYGGPCGNSSCTPAEAFQRLAEWIENRKLHGVYLNDHLVFAHNPNWGNGIVALTQWGILRGTVVVKMPKKYCLTTRTVSSTKLREFLEHPVFDPITGLTIAYIYECLLDQESGWYGYLSCMSLPDVPRLWEDEEWAWLKGTEAEDQTFDFDVSVQISFHFGWNSESSVERWKCFAGLCFRSFRHTLNCFRWLLECQLYDWKGCFWRPSLLS